MVRHPTKSNPAWTMRPLLVDDSAAAEPDFGSASGATSRASQPSTGVPVGRARRRLEPGQAVPPRHSAPAGSSRRLLEATLTSPSRAAHSASERFVRSVDQHHCLEVDP